MRQIILALCIALFTTTATAQLRLDLEATSIIGNREVPRIVYLMAWKEAPQGDILQQSLESMHDTEFEPLDRDVFKRRIGYHKMLFDAGKE